MKRLFIIAFLGFVMSVSGQSIISTDSINNSYIPYGVRPVVAKIESTSAVECEKLRQASATNLIQSLYGLLPGVNISQTTGEPGEENNELFIRGKASLLENIPLILVDGVETSYQQIHWSEVDQVTVLKDAASLAIYGLRGANGVLLVNTKRGSVTGKPTVTFSVRYGSQSPLSLPTFASTADYMSMYNEARENDGMEPVYDAATIAGYENNTDMYLYSNVNWYNEVLKATAPVSDYSLTFSGGSKNVRYFLMLGYLNNQGIYAGTDPKRDKNSNINLDRFSFRSNIDVSVTKDFTVSLDLSGRVLQKIQPNVNISDHWKSMNSISFFPVTTPDGRWAGRQGQIANPKAAILEGGYRSYHSRELNETLRLHYSLSSLVEGLGIFGTVSFSSWFETNYDKTKQYPYFELNLRPGTTPGTADVAYDYVMRGTYSDVVISQGSYWQWNRNNIEGGFDYKNSWGNHSVDALLAYHQNVYRANGVHSPYAQQRLMGRIQYAYNNTYLAMLSASYSGSDNYKKGERFGFFPSAGLAWVASSEEFLKKGSVINHLKISASTGLTGSDRIGNTGRWAYEQYFTSGSGITVGGETTTGLGNLVEGRLPNPFLTWEKAWKSNLALETTLFKNLTFSTDLFYEKRNDILVSAAGTRPSYIGITLPFVNEGVTENRGVELSINYSSKAGAVTYYAGGNFSFIRSKVINKNEEPRMDSYRWETGQPIGMVYGLEAIGFFENQDDIDNSPKQLFGATKPGDIKYRDLNNDNFVDELDMKAIGKPTYPELIYAFNAGLEFAGIDFSLLLQGVGERSLILSGNMVKPFVDNARITEWAVNGRWTPENAANATYPRLSTLDNSNNYCTSTFWLRNGAFMRLKNIELGYTFPQQFTQKIHIAKCRIYMNTNNLFTFTEFSSSDADPESFDINKYPLMRTVNAGLNVTF